MILLVENYHDSMVANYKDTIAANYNDIAIATRYCSHTILIL